MDAAGPPPGDRGPLADARRRPGWLGWAAALSVGAVLLAAGWTDRRDEPVGDRTVGEVTRVGVGPGDAIPTYLRSAATELAALPPADASAGTYALVSFDAYLRPDALPAVLADVSVVEVVARVPLPDRQTEVVHLAAQRTPQDVLAGMAGVADRKDREAADQRDRAAAAAEPLLRRTYSTGAEVAVREARAYRAGCGCVYAAVVRAAPDALRELATRPGVRGVDPAPEVRRLDRTVFLPPLPEQRDVVRPPADTALTPEVGDSSEAAPDVTGSSPDRAPAGTARRPPTTAPTSPDVGAGRSSPPSR
ncbi:hypothetical protein [Micromonospora sp. CPCC 205556]|uniref:hypothetical protein n=1 Tax=Micromonospora sp. CPCC 205556 TaxID=3122398 RepID=UPI002FF31537